MRDYWGLVRRYVLKLGDSEVRLTPGHWRLGRDPACEIRLSDESVSRRHAVLRVSDGGVEISDQGSRNGIRINGDRVYGRGELEIGDRIQVGIYDLELTEVTTSASVMGATRPLPKLPKTGVESLELLSKREREVFERLARGETQRGGRGARAQREDRRDLPGTHPRQARACLAPTSSRLPLETGIPRPGSA
ncbi:MAG: FHA domain-containing protein [Sandaracinaceae bacterium]